jgi:ankyrin repeat protein
MDTTGGGLSGSGIVAAGPNAAVDVATANTATVAAGFNTDRVGTGPGLVAMYAPDREQILSNTDDLCTCVTRGGSARAEVNALIIAVTMRDQCRVHRAEVNALIIAVTMRDQCRVHTLLDNGADINTMTSRGHSALTMAAALGDDGMVELLLKRGAPVRGLAMGGTWPLFSAVSENHVLCAHLLIAANADVNELTDDKFALLHIATTKGYAAVTELLCVSGADMEIGNRNGTTPLMKACQNGHHACITVLVKAGCNVDAIDNDGRTALMYAVNDGQLKCVRALTRSPTGVDTGVRAINEAKGINELALDLLKDDGSVTTGTIRRLLGRACAQCLRLKTKMYKCARCEKVYYHAAECQRAHWPLHKAKCVVTATVVKPAESDEMRLQAAGNAANHSTRPFTAATPAHKVGCSDVAEEQVEPADEHHQEPACSTTSVSSGMLLSSRQP